MNDLNVLYPQPVTTTVSGVKAEIRPIKLRNIQLFSGLLAELTALLANPTALNLAAFCAKHGAAIGKLLEAQTSLSPKQLKELSANDAVAWLNHLVWMNLDDFSRALSSTASSLQDGATSTSDLSAQGTRRTQ